MRKSYKIICSVIAIILITASMFLFVCSNKNSKLKKLTFHKRPSQHEKLVHQLDIELSPEAQTVVLEILLIPYYNREFDSDIGKRNLMEVKESPEQILEIWNKRQFREGCIFTIKEKINSIDIPYFMAILHRNLSDIDSSVKSSGPHYNNSNRDTSYYSEGRKIPIDFFLQLNSKISEEVLRTSSKYLEEDKNWRSKGIAVPSDLVIERLKETPHLQAVIFLQKVFNKCYACPTPAP